MDKMYEEMAVEAIASAVKFSDANTRPIVRALEAVTYAILAIGGTSDDEDDDG